MTPTQVLETDDGLVHPDLEAEDLPQTHDSWLVQARCTGARTDEPPIGLIGTPREAATSALARTAKPRPFRSTHGTFTQGPIEARNKGLTQELPITGVVPALLAGLRSRRNFVLQAEPGAGKTTGVPPVLLREGCIGPGALWVTQPRRLAAKVAAHRVAQLLGERTGETCGYAVRFESKHGPKTRILFVTEGLLARRLRDEPELTGVSAVILDEFHERSLDADLSLALLRRLQTTTRADLGIGVMSATLQTDPVADHLECDPLHCPGRTHPVEVEFADKSSDRPLENQVLAALRRLVDEGLDGSVLVFLPGASEIRRTAETCERLARAAGLDLVRLHGDLSGAEQDAAIARGPRPKVILSTNIAETSITVEGVVAVIDGGLARRPAHDPWTGIPSLTLAKISKASAAQRAGRAGRTQPGRCLRLYTKADFDRRPEHDAPELQRSDLTAAVLDLRGAGVRDPSTLPWLEPPPTPALEAAEALLVRLGAVDSRGALTATGRAMLTLPIAPRLARVVVEARERGIAGLGTTAAALLSERDLVRTDPTLRARRAASSDVWVDLERLERASRGRDTQADRGARRQIIRVRDQLRTSLGSSRDDASDPEEALCMSLLAGFPDRVARVQHRKGPTASLALADGGSAELAASSVVLDSEFIVALTLEARRGGARSPTVLVRRASMVEAEWLLELFPDQVEERLEVRFDEARERVESILTLRYQGLVIDETSKREPSPEAAEVLRRAALARGPAHFVDEPEALTDLEHRSAFAHAQDPSVEVFDEARAASLLATLCEGTTSFAEVRRSDLLAHAKASLGPEGTAILERLAPTHVTLPGGRRLRVHYEADRPPWVESRLQDFFGSVDGPKIGRGQPLVLHLLAPNRRAVQVTTDLSGFWSRHYPDLRKTLMRRYPKHDWPEDPVTAKPPAPGRTRRRH